MEEGGEGGEGGEGNKKGVTVKNRNTGNVKFIGELFNAKLLKPKRINDIIQQVCICIYTYIRKFILFIISYSCIVIW